MLMNLGCGDTEQGLEGAAGTHGGAAEELAGGQPEAALREGWTEGESAGAAEQTE